VKILVDADACPVKGIIVSVARQYKLEVTMLVDTSHELNDGYSTVITVDKARDSVDIALINLVKAGDLVVSQDYGVAAMALGKKAKAVNQNGRIYSDDNIDELLFERHIGQKVRRAGGRTSSIRKRTKEDDASFEKTFRSLVEQAISS
jgi:uncharacterized protein